MGRVYRSNTTQIDLRGDGPSRQDSMSTNSVNESRRRRAVEALTQQANAASKLADRVENGTIDLQSRLDSISDTVDSDMRRDGGRPMIGASRADMFEGYISNNLLGDDNYGHGKGTVARMLREAYEVAEQAPKRLRNRRAEDALMFSRAPAGGQTETAEFKRWFAGSKVVDADGKPLVVYHGTRRPFNRIQSVKAKGCARQPGGHLFHCRQGCSGGVRTGH